MQNSITQEWTNTMAFNTLTINSTVHQPKRTNQSAYIKLRALMRFPIRPMAARGDISNNGGPESAVLALRVDRVCLQYC